MAESPIGPSTLKTRKRVGDAKVEAKVAYLFRLTDRDGDGRVDRTELAHMLHDRLTVNRLVLGRETIDRLIDVLIKEADVNGDDVISHEEFRRIFEFRPELVERLTYRPPEEARNTPRDGRLEALGWIRRWAVLGFWLGVFIAANLWLFVDAFLAYRAHGASLPIQVARGCGACLNLDAPLLLVPMLRHLWTMVRRTPLERVLPLDENVSIHKFIGEVVFALSVVHSVAHVANIAMGGATLWRATNLTGFVLLALLVLIWVCARDRVRAAGRFELFHRVHTAWWLWFVVALFHGPNLWQWMLAPAVAYAVERLLRRSLRRDPVKLVDAMALPSGVMNLRFERPPGFAYESGMFVWIRVPAIARSEWHPFTLTSAPEVPEALSVHVRSLGNWTRALHERFREPGSHAGQVIEVDGPYGTPSVHIRASEHVVTVAAGIGVTPFASVLESLRRQRARKRMDFRLKRLHFVWISRDQDAFEWFTQRLRELEADNQDGWLDIHIYFTAARREEASVLELARMILHETHGTDLITGLASRTHFGRPDVRAMLATFAAEPGLPPPDVFFCGAPALARELSDACQSLGLSFRCERF